MQTDPVKKAEGFIKEHKLITAGDRVLVGLSGGGDSVCLLTILQELSDKLQITLGAFHVNHGIRGAEADGDERFSKKLCEAFGIRFYSAKEDVPAYAKEHKLGLEEAGRELRYRAARQIAEREGYTKIALAHHRNDVAETFLFHLLRGSSLSGLSSIPAEREGIIRPLLGFTREEIEQFLAERQLSYRTDSTNNLTEYTRNKIRHEMVTFARKEINAGAVDHIADTAAELSEINDYLEEVAEVVYAGAEKEGKSIRIPVELLLDSHGVIRRKVLYRMISEAAGSKKDITKGHVTRVEDLLTGQSGRQVSLPYGLVAGRSFSDLYVTSVQVQETKTEHRDISVEVPGEYFTGKEGESLQFRTFPYKKNTEIPKNEYTKWFDYDKIRGTLCLRSYRTGDRLGLLAGTKSVKSLWTEHKIPKEERQKRTLIADDEQVIWIPGIRCCDNYRIDERTKTVLEIQKSGGKENGSECQSADS